MKKEFVDTAKAPSDPQSKKPPAKKDEPIELETPASVELMLGALYEAAYIIYNIDMENYRYIYTGYDDGSFILTFKSGILDRHTTIDDDHRHYRKISAMLRDMKALLTGNQEDIFLYPEKLQIACANKFALYNLLDDYMDANEEELQTPSSLDYESLFAEFMPSGNIPDNRHSQLEIVYSVGKKYDSYMQQHPEILEVAKNISLPRQFASISQYKATMVCALSANSYTCMNHIYKVIMQEEKMSAGQYAAPTNYGGYN